MGRAVWLGLGAAIAVAYLTRLTFAVPHLAIAGGLLAGAFAGPRILGRLHDAEVSRALRDPARAACLWAPLVAAFALQGWYNVERFGSPFVYTSHASLLAYALDPELAAHHEAVGTFNPARIPINFRHYLGLHGRIDAKPPFAHLEPNRGMGDDLYLPGYREWNLSLWLGSGWLVAGALAGLVRIARNRRWLAALAALAFSSQLAVVLTYYWVSQRFTAELLPLLCWGFAFALPGLAASRRWQAVCAAFVAISIAVTLASTLSWQADFNWGAPDAYRASLREAFGR
jgi:hypothetical protein